MGDKKPEDWIIVEGMHEAIIDRDTYDIVQEKIRSRKRADTWENFSLFAGLRSCARQALSDEQESAAQLRENCQADEQAEQKAIQRSIAEDSERITALDRIISRVYEDMIAGRINEDNFNRILENSQSEQGVLKNRIALNRERMTQQVQEQEDNTRWLEIIKDYADIQQLDAMTLNRLVQKIVIHEDKDGDTIRQTVEIHFNFNNQPDKRRLIRKK